jgi:predicted house-cleaning noncanonical NTP pyrophosphatase (MazG superfamily)
MKFNKLVRDGIPAIIGAKGQTAVTHVATDDEYWLKLREKIKEEAAEFAEDPNDEELADILEVVHAVCDYRKISMAKLESTRKKKLEERGGFKGRLILEETK